MPKKILIVDDEPLIVKGLKYSLEQDGYETDSSQDGEEAVNKFFAGQYDLVLLDVMLPKLDGIEVCQRIREKSNVPIIMLTAKEMCIRDRAFSATKSCGILRPIWSGGEKRSTAGTGPTGPGCSFWPAYSARP